MKNTTKTESEKQINTKQTHKSDKKRTKPRKKHKTTK